MIGSNLNEKYWLIVDDDYDVVTVITEFLEENGFNAIKCTDPREVLDIISKYHLCGVICDFVMPHMNGFGVHDLIRLHEKTSIPFIMISGRADLVSDERFSDKTNTHFFSKPVDFEKLLKFLTDNIKSNVLIDPEDYRSLQVAGLVSIAENNDENVPVTLMEFSSDIMTFEVERSTIQSGTSYNISLSCECKGKLVTLKFSGKAIKVSPIDNSEVDEVTFDPIDLDEEAYEKIAETYREKQLYIENFLRLAKGLT